MEPLQPHPNNVHIWAHQHTSSVDQSPTNKGTEGFRRGVEDKGLFELVHTSYTVLTYQQPRCRSVSKAGKSIAQHNQMTLNNSPGPPMLCNTSTMSIKWQPSGVVRRTEKQRLFWGRKFLFSVLGSYRRRTCTSKSVALHQMSCQHPHTWNLCILCTLSIIQTSQNVLSVTLKMSFGMVGPQEAIVRSMESQEKKQHWAISSSVMCVEIPPNGVATVLRPLTRSFGRKRNIGRCRVSALMSVKTSTAHQSFINIHRRYSSFLQLVCSNSRVARYDCGTASINNLRWAGRKYQTWG